MMSSALRGSERCSARYRLAEQRGAHQGRVRRALTRIRRALARIRWTTVTSTAVITTTVVTSCVGCKSDAAKEHAAPTTEPERFTFALPESFVPVELRGEGSETLRAPAGARVTRTDGGFEIKAGPDFDLELVSHAPTLGELAAPPSVARVFSETDLSMFKSEQGYSFVTVRELVPEWDESARQRFACGSAGGVVRGGSGAASARGFSKAAAENMVASCRTLELPALE
jgi:hypothetical protein